MSGGCLAIEVEEASNSSAATVIVDVKGDNEDGAAGVSLAPDARTRVVVVMLGNGSSLRA